MYKIELEHFNGPLDLLLQLIEGQKLDISQVSLAKVTDQYLQYLDQLTELSAGDLADFLVVATKLLVIKSKSLLPVQDDDEEDSADQLEAQLRMYKEYLEATKKLETMVKEGNFCFGREKLAVSFEPSFSPPPSLATSDLKAAFEQIIGRIDYVVNLPKKVLDRAISLAEVVSNMRQSLAMAKKTDFRTLVSQAKSKSEVVVHFMALLEMIKAGEVAVTQDGILDEIMVEGIG